MVSFKTVYALAYPALQKSNDGGFTCQQWQQLSVFAAELNISLRIVHKQSQRIPRSHKSKYNNIDTTV